VLYLIKQKSAVNMNPTTFPDGFPRDPLKAIEYSYFFSDEEKQDWRDWLQSAPSEQQEELVEILHNMWLDHQKQAIPNGFQNGNTQDVDLNTMPAATPTQAVAQPVPAAPAPTTPVQSQPVMQPAPIKEAEIQLEPIAQDPEASYYPTETFEMEDGEDKTDMDQMIPEFDLSQETPIPPADIPTPVVKPVPQASITQSQPAKPIPAAQPQIKDIELDDKTIRENIRNLGSEEYTPNPLLQNMPERTADRIEPPLKQPQPSKNNNASQVQDNGNGTKTKANPSQNPQAKSVSTAQPVANKQPAPAFQVAKVRETATREMLEDIYNNYVSTRARSFKSEQELHELHAAFLDKIMKVVVNFEQVADYFESMTTKLLEMNDTIVDQASKLAAAKAESDRRFSKLERSVEDVSDDNQRNERKIKDVGMDSRDRYNELSQQLASFGADAYRQDGVNSRIDLLSARIQKLEGQDSIAQRVKKVVQNKANRNDSEETKVIDLREEM
jgi:uncharacterized membrane-anchored protein YhcB (DUF1043 family)